MVRGAARTPGPLRPLPLGASGLPSRGQVRRRAGAGVARGAGAWRRRRRCGRRSSVWSPSALPIRSPLLARGLDPRRRRSGRKPAAPQRGSRLRASPARAGAGGTDARLGPRRAARRGDVELELDRGLAPGSRRARRRGHPAAGRRACSRLAGGARRRATPSRATLSRVLERGAGPAAALPTLAGT